jgi:hypothetical protein
MKIMSLIRLTATLTSIFISSLGIASNESIIAGFIDRTVTPLDNLVIEQDDYSTSITSVISYDIIKTNSLISPYSGTIVFGGITRYKDCLEKETTEEFACEQLTRPKRYRTIHFQYHYKNGWIPVKISYRGKDTPINEALKQEKDKNNPIMIYLTSFFEKD